ncbi:phosphoribosyl-AMP cyclohydrolase [Chloroflexota bacterium]
MMKKLKFDKNGLLTGVAQDIDTYQVLMVAMMNAEAVRLTLKTKQAHFWSRSREELWLKGGTSGNILEVQEIKVDCDRDALLLLVKPRGPACHTGKTTCFCAYLEEKKC